jgi:hypothetical protein
MRPLLSSLVAIVALSQSTLAAKGVISDTITSDAQGCRSLCGLNDDCFMVLFDNDCNECWQLDCSVDRQPVEGLDATGKDTDATAPKCDDGVKFPEKRKECKEQSELSASTTIIAATTSDGGATPTETSTDDDKDDSSNDKGNEKDAGFRAKSLSWTVLAGGVLAATALIAS